MPQWLCYEYCSVEKCNTTYYWLYSRCRLMDSEGTLYDERDYNYGCKC